MIDNACRVAIEAGVDPVVAISMALPLHGRGVWRITGCRDPHELRGAIAPGKRADLLVLNDLTFATAPHRVYAAGALVAQDGTFVGEIAPEMAEVAALPMSCVLPLSCRSYRSTCLTMPLSRARL